MTNDRQNVSLIERIGNGIARSRFGSALFGDERRRMRETFQLMSEGYSAGPWELPPQELARQMTELDPYYLQDIINQLGWDIIGGSAGILGSSAERERAVESAERLYRYSPLGQFAVWLWSSWGLGDRIDVIPTDETAKVVFTEFFTADRNSAVLGDDHLKELSDWLLVTGNRFLVFFSSEIDGKTTMRTIEPEEINEIVKNPEDGTEPWFYRREYSIGLTTTKTIYYPDWQLYFNDDMDVDKAWEILVKLGKVKDTDIRSDRRIETEIGDNTPGTIAVIMHISFNRKERASLWGWPIFTASASWLRSHKAFAETRLAAAQSVNAYVRRYQVDGGSRHVKSVKNTVASNLSQYNYTDSNPPATGGSSEVVNKTIDVSDLPLRTGATDAKVDNDLFSWMALLGSGIFPVTAGLDTARWATAVQMDKAQSMLFEAYQTLWSTQFRRVVKIVLSFAEKFGSKKFQNMESQVSIDSFSLSDFPDVAEALGQVTRDMLSTYTTDGTINQNTARMILQQSWRLIFQSLGVSDPVLTSDEAWEVERPELSEIDKTKRDEITSLLSPGMDRVGQLVKANKLQEALDEVQAVIDGIVIAQEKE